MFQKKTINNELYKSLGDKWYHGNDYVELLRSEAKTRNPWIMLQIEKYFNKMFRKKPVMSKILENKENLSNY